MHRSIAVNCAEPLGDTPYYIMTVWLQLAALGLLAIGGLLLLRVIHDLEDRVAALDRELAAVAAELVELDDHEGATAQETRRAHVRIDNHHRQLRALAEQMGWADEHARTKLLTGTVPLPPKEEP